MNARIDSLYGIVNGIDYEEFNPETDPHIETNYTVKNAVAGKRKNKLALQKMLGLPVRDDVFMIGIISRMTSQKGFDLIAYILDEIFDTMDVQFVVLGTGEGQYENMFHHFHNKYPDKLWAHIGYSDEYAHKIYASCDAFLMPSLFEPCGLGQMMAMRYGTLPIVRETGGLKDTVEAYNEYENTGTGFSFSNYNAHEMLFILRYAQNIYKENRSRWNEIVQRAMQKDFSWGASAKSYESLYDKVTEDIK